jgi:hypothetical protein
MQASGKCPAVTVVRQAVEQWMTGMSMERKASKLLRHREIRFSW